MRKLFSIRKFPYIGINIIAGEVYCVEIGRNSRPKKYSCDIKEIARLCSKPVAIALPDSEIVNKKFTVAAALKSQEIIKYLQNNLQRLTEFRYSEVNLDIILSKRAGSKREVELYLAPKKMVAAKVKEIEQYGVKVAVVEPSAVALERGNKYRKKNFAPGNFSKTASFLGRLSSFPDTGSSPAQALTGESRTSNLLGLLDPAVKPRDDVSNKPRDDVSNKPRDDVSNKPRDDVSNKPQDGGKGFLVQGEKIEPEFLLSYGLALWRK